MDKLIKDFINSVRVELADEFDMNFRRKAFFNKKWPKTKHNYKTGSLMMRSTVSPAMVPASLVACRCASSK